MGTQQQVEQEITISAAELTYAEKMESKKMFYPSKRIKQRCARSSGGTKGVLSSVKQTCMITFLTFWVLTLASTAEAANSTSSVQATTTSKAATTLDWVKITAVPLGVILIGACILGIIADTTARWRSGGPPEEEVAPPHRHINNGATERDLEEGLELSHRGTDDDLAMAPNAPVVSDENDAV